MMLRFTICAALLVVLGACDRDKPKAEPPVASPSLEAVKSAAPLAVASAAPSAHHMEEIEAPEVTVRPTGTTVHVVWSAPAGTGVNEEAPFKVRWNRSEGLEAPPEMKSTGAMVKDGFDVPVKPFAGVPHANLAGTIDLVVCDTATHKVCIPVKRSVDLGFIVSKDAPAETKLTVKLPEAKPPS
jgi:hypothetical protein